MKGILYVIVTISFNHMVRVISYIFMYFRIVSIQILELSIGLSLDWNFFTIVLLTIFFQREPTIHLSLGT